MGLTSLAYRIQNEFRVANGPTGDQAEELATKLLAETKDRNATLQLQGAELKALVQDDVEAFIKANEKGANNPSNEEDKVEEDSSEDTPEEDGSEDGVQEDTSEEVTSKDAAKENGGDTDAPEPGGSGGPGEPENDGPAPTGDGTDAPKE